MTFFKHEREAFLARRSPDKQAFPLAAKKQSRSHFPGRLPFLKEVQAPDAVHAMAEEDQYKIKRVEFFGRKQVPIVMQNENGPCPLLAIANILLLRNAISLQPDTATEIGVSRLLSLVVERLLDSNASQEGRSEQFLQNREQNLSDALSVIPQLATGIDVNVKFGSVFDFEFTPETAIFDLLDISLVHGWLMDPQDKATVEAIGNQSYNKLIEIVLTHPEAAAVLQTQSAATPQSSIARTGPAGEGAVATSAGAAGEEAKKDLLAKQPPDSAAEETGKPVATEEVTGEDPEGSREQFQGTLPVQESESTTPSVERDQEHSAGLGRLDSPLSSDKAATMGDQGSRVMHEGAASALPSSDRRDGPGGVPCDPNAEVSKPEEGHSSGHGPEVANMEAAVQTLTIRETDAEQGASILSSEAKEDPHASAMPAAALEAAQHGEGEGRVEADQSAATASASTEQGEDLPGRREDPASSSVIEQEREANPAEGEAHSDAANLPKLGEAAAGNASGSSTAAAPADGKELRNAMLIATFLAETASQLTYHGFFVASTLWWSIHSLFSLQESLNDQQLAVFFRNNHFSTLFKRQGQLYVLVTDQGYLDRPGVVWEKLGEVEGDNQFFSGDFCPFVGTMDDAGPGSQLTAEDEAVIANIIASDMGVYSGSAPAQDGDFSTDRQLALMLQQQEEENARRQNTSVHPKDFSAEVPPNRAPFTVTEGGVQAGKVRGMPNRVRAMPFTVGGQQPREGSSSIAGSSSSSSNSLWGGASWFNSKETSAPAQSGQGQPVARTDWQHGRRAPNATRSANPPPKGKNEKEDCCVM